MQNEDAARPEAKRPTNPLAVLSLVVTLLVAVVFITALSLMFRIG
jgi:hypothetical protein